MSSKIKKALKTHLIFFDAEYPIKKGYVARLMQDRSEAEVLKEVKTVIQTAEPNKQLNEENLTENIQRFKKLLEKKIATCEWATLIKFFLEPFPVAFKNFPILLPGVQSVEIVTPSPVRPSKQFAPFCALSPQSAQPSLVETSLTVSDEPRTPENSLDSLASLRYLSSESLAVECEKCAQKERANTAMLYENTRLRMRLSRFSMQHIEERSRVALKKLQEIIKKKAKSVHIWKGKYATVKKAAKKARKRFQLLQISEEKVKVLQSKLAFATLEISKLKEIIKELKSKLQQTHRRLNLIKSAESSS